MTLAVFDEHRGHLFAVAYRMLGSVAEAEDVVQEAWLRWSADDRDDVRSPVAFLTTVVSRLALDRLRAARAQREVYVGPWLPEPLVDGVDPVDAAELDESVTTGFLVLLERLNPIERAVLLLHEVFGYRFDEVAAIVGRPAASCRQSASRARAKLRPDRRPAHRGDPDDGRRLVEAFAVAAGTGDLAGLERLLADDVVLWSDGGAQRHAARRPVVGADRVARFVANIARRQEPGAAISFATVNGEPGLVVRGPTGAIFTLAIEPGPDGIRAVHVVINPDKLRHL